jgi:lysozyme
MNNHKTNKAGIELIKKNEGLVLKAYWDVTNYSIGYGHNSPDIKAGQTISEATAVAFLKQDLSRFEDAIRRYITTELNENQFSALVSFTYNVGEGNLAKSTLRNYINEGNCIRAADEFQKWTKSAGKTLPALVKRRQEEKALFLKPVSKEIEPNIDVTPASEISQISNIEQPEATEFPFSKDSSS